MIHTLQASLVLLLALTSVGYWLALGAPLPADRRQP